MATGRFDIKYPPRNYIGFDGGLNTKTAKQWLLENESPDCLNVIFGPGYVETRPGSTTLNTAPVSTHSCDGIYTRHSNAGAESMCVWFGGNMSVLSGTTFVAVASAASVMTAGQRVCSAEYENHRFFGNGYVIPYKYNGTDFTRHGIYPPTSGPTAGQTAASGSSILSGLYSWKITYVNSALVESDLSPATSSVVYSGSTGAYLTSIPVAPQSWGVNTRYVYRTDNSGVAYYRAGTIGNNTATTYTDTTTDAGLGAAAPTDQGVPPYYNVILTHNSRMFMLTNGTNDNFVWYTEAGNPYIVKATNFRRIGDETAEIPTGLSVWDNYLVVTCKSGQTWLVYMPDNDDTNWVDFRLRSDYGSEAPFAIFQAMNKVIFPAQQNGKFVGFGALTAEGLDPQASLTSVGAIGSDLMSEGIQSEIDAFVGAYVKNMSAIVWKNKAYITFTKTGSTTNNRILVLDFSNQNLSKKQKYTWAPWTGLNIAQFCIYDGNVYGGSSTANGLVYKLLQSNYDDSGTAINSYFKTKEFYGLEGQEIWFKDWRFVNLLYELSGTWDIGFITSVDSDLGSGVSELIDVSPATAVWGTLVWGSGNWEAGRSEIDLKKSLNQFRGKRIQFSFTNLNTVGTKFKIVGLSLRYNLKGTR